MLKTTKQPKSSKHHSRVTLRRHLAKSPSKRSYHAQKFKPLHHTIQSAAFSSTPAEPEHTPTIPAPPFSDKEKYYTTSFNPDPAFNTLHHYCYDVLPQALNVTPQPQYNTRNPYLNLYLYTNTKHWERFFDRTIVFNKSGECFSPDQMPPSKYLSPSVPRLDHAMAPPLLTQITLATEIKTLDQEIIDKTPPDQPMADIVAARKSNIVKTTQIAIPLHLTRDNYELYQMYHSKHFHHVINSSYGVKSARIFNPRYVTSMLPMTYDIPIAVQRRIDKNLIYMSSTVHNREPNAATTSTSAPHYAMDNTITVPLWFHQKYFLPTFIESYTAILNHLDAELLQSFTKAKKPSASHSSKSILAQPKRPPSAEQLDLIQTQLDSICTAVTDPNQFSTLQMRYTTSHTSPSAFSASSQLKQEQPQRQSGSKTLRLDQIKDITDIDINSFFYAMLDQSVTKISDSENYKPLNHLAALSLSVDSSQFDSLLSSAPSQLPHHPQPLSPHSHALSDSATTPPSSSSSPQAPSPTAPTHNFQALIFNNQNNIWNLINTAPTPHADEIAAILPTTEGSSTDVRLGPIATPNPSQLTVQTISEWFNYIINRDDLLFIASPDHVPCITTNTPQ